MDDDDTPETKRGGPPRPLPTLTSLQASVDAALREVRGARIDIDSLKTGLRAVRTAVETPPLPPISLVPKPEAVAETEPRPSMAAKAAHGTKLFGRYTAYVVAAAAIIGQVLAAALPHQQGPLVELLRVALAYVQQQGGQ